MRRRAKIVLWAGGLVCLATAIVAGGWWWSGSHALLPGLAGCEHIRQTGARGDCVERHLREVMRDRSAKAGLTAVDRLAKDRTLVDEHCHLAMHPIGEDAGRRAARRDADPPPSVGTSSTCRVGYMHGVMIGYVTERGGDLGDALPQLCARDAQGPSGCAHVVGHLLARESYEGEPEQVLEETCLAPGNDSELSAVARRVAEQGAIDTEARVECVRGGFMEIALIERQPPLGRWSERCIDAPASTRVECFKWLPALATYRRQPQKRSAGICERAGLPPAVRDDCIEGVAGALPPSSKCSVFGEEKSRARCANLR